MDRLKFNKQLSWHSRLDIAAKILILSKYIADGKVKLRFLVFTWQCMSVLEVTIASSVCGIQVDSERRTIKSWVVGVGRHKSRVFEGMKGQLVRHVAL